MPNIKPVSGPRDSAICAVIALHGDQAIAHITAEIEAAVKRSDDGAVTGLDRLLRQLEALDRKPAK